MKSIILSITLLSIIFINISCNRSATKENANADYQLLVDFTSDDSGNPPYHLSKKELKDLTNRIKATTGKKGAVTIRSSALGSFTGPNEKEIIHIAFQEDPTASHAEGWGHTYFVVINSNSMKIINPGECGAERIFKTIHMPNGLDYLFMTSEFGGQGVVEIAAGLVSLAKNPLDTAILIKNFNNIYTDSCGGLYAEESGRVAASKLSYKWKNDKLEFKREHFIKKCADSSKFQFVEISDKNDNETELPKK